MIAAFVALAIGWTGLEDRLARVGEPAGPYPPAAVTSAADAPRPTLWIVDGFNLLHVVLLAGEPREAWWQRGGRDRVLELARGFDEPGVEVVVVFDGARPAADPEPRAAGQPRVVFASPADDWVLAALRTAPDPARVAVVTADRRLAARARRRGAQVVAPGAFAGRCRAGSADATRS